MAYKHTHTTITRHSISHTQNVRAHCSVGFLLIETPFTWENSKQSACIPQTERLSGCSNWRGIRCFVRSTTTQFYSGLWTRYFTNHKDIRISVQLSPIPTVDGGRPNKSGDRFCWNCRPGWTKNDASNRTFHFLLSLQKPFSLFSSYHPFHPPSIFSLSFPWLLQNINQLITKNKIKQYNLFHLKWFAPATTKKQRDTLCHSHV